MYRRAFFRTAICGFAAAFGLPKTRGVDNLQAEMRSLYNRAIKSWEEYDAIYFLDPTLGPCRLGADLEQS